MTTLLELETLEESCDHEWVNEYIESYYYDYTLTRCTKCDEERDFEGGL